MGRGTVPSRSDQYRLLQLECLKLAEMLPRGERRDTMIRMAENWQHMAEEQERATDLRKKE